jgi:hypothetical protein
MRQPAAGVSAVIRILTSPLEVRSATTALTLTVVASVCVGTTCPDGLSGRLLVGLAVEVAGSVRTGSDPPLSAG